VTVTTPAQYKINDMKGTKIQKFAWFGGYGSLKVIGNIAIRESTNNFLFDFNRNYASVQWCCQDLKVWGEELGVWG